MKSPIIVECEVWKGESDYFLVFGDDVYRMETDDGVKIQGAYGGNLVFGQFLGQIDSFIGEYQHRARAAIRWQAS